MAQFIFVQKNECLSSIIFYFFPTLWQGGRNAGFTSYLQSVERHSLWSDVELNFTRPRLLHHILLKVPVHFQQEAAKHHNAQHTQALEKNTQIIAESQRQIMISSSQNLLQDLRLKESKHATQ